MKSLFNSSKKENCELFAESTTLHGLKHVGGDFGRIRRRVLWLILMLVMIVLLCMHFISSLTTYLRHPTTTSINIVPSSSLTFPTITICDNNPIKQSYMDEHPLVGNVSAIHAPLMKLAPTMNLSQPEVVEEMKSISYIDIFKQGGNKQEDTLMNCFWQAVVVNCSEIFVHVMVDLFGLCHSFNVRGDLQVKTPGILNGLQVFMMVNQEEYSHSAFSGSAGVRILVHENTTSPAMDIDSVSASPGMQTDLMIYRKETIYLPHPYDGPDCDADNKFTSLKDCEQTCTANYLKSACGCQVAHVLTGVRQCSLYEYHTCVASAMGEYHINPELKESCGCLHNCHEVTYDVKSSQMQFPSQYGADYLLQNHNDSRTLTEFRDSLLGLNIYFNTLQTTVTEQVSSYSFATFSAEMGGYLGLYLGASLLTLSELLEFLTFLLLSFCHKTKEVTTVQPFKTEMSGIQKQ